MSHPGSSVRIARADVAALVGRARALAEADPRRARPAILGITGPPGAGKSTLAEQIVGALAPRSVLVPMDGFHLAGIELARLGRAERKGAPDTFDAAGFVALLRRLREPARAPDPADASDASDVSEATDVSEAADACEAVVYAPAFRRDLEEPVAGAIAVNGDVRLVVTEGNYLLHDGPWRAVRALLDETWYLDTDDDERVERLIARHRRYGRSESQARAWALGSDQRNPDVVAATKPRADVIVDGTSAQTGGR